ncbi:MAG: prepilin-type N-terminal cleavage/methylation domain-containing protein [bacterium]
MTNDKGFTLLELMLAMILSLIIIFSIYGLYISTKKASYIHDDITDMHQNVRTALEFVSRELRNNYKIISFNSTLDNSSIEFFAIEDSGTVSIPATYINELNDLTKSWVSGDWNGHLLSIIAGTGRYERGAISGGTNNTIVDLSKSWSMGQWDNYWLVILEGTGKGQVKMIKTTYNNKLKISSDWEITQIPDSTSVYGIWQRIEKTYSKRLKTYASWSSIDTTSLYQIITIKGFKRDAQEDELEYKTGTITAWYNPLTENTTGFTLEGYDSGDSVTSNPAAIQKIKIMVKARTADMDQAIDDYHYYTATTTVALRNF